MSSSSACTGGIRLLIVPGDPVARTAVRSGLDPGRGLVLLAERARLGEPVTPQIPVVMPTELAAEVAHHGCR